jgi:hypothetical protein
MTRRQRILGVIEDGVSNLVWYGLLALRGTPLF